MNEDGPWSDDTVNLAYQHRLRSSLRVQMPNASDWENTYGYDEARHLRTISSPAGTFQYQYRVQELEYDPYAGQIYSLGSQVRSLTLPSGAAITNDFDLNGRLVRTRLLDSDSAILNLHEYVYDRGNQRTQQVFTAGNRTDYTYDSIGQLKTAKGKEANGTTIRAHEQLTYA